MLFNSIDFAVFLPIVFFLYWYVLNSNIRRQNLLIVVSSYFFYGWWDWRFLSLMLFSTIVDYSVGRALKSEERARYRRLYLWLSIAVNIGFLATFKYYDFFIENFVAAFSYFGMNFKPATLGFVLPVGISFYTFQTLSYTIDVYKKKIKPTDDFILFSAYVSFFPQLVAGPIERAKNLLPQFQKSRVFDRAMAVSGLQQILWGLFKKVVIADNCAVYADYIFSDPSIHPGSSLVLGVFLFTFQIYGDFSGYSDIAIGTAKLFGFNLMKNFAYPYFSRDIAEFWRRWHISLSTWFRDYLYIPLGGSRGGTFQKIRNTFIIFIVSGFWHGANWTFIVWGALNALYFIPLLLAKRNRKNLDTIASNSFFPPFRELMSMTITFWLTVFAWIFFRSDSIGQAGVYISGIFTKSLFSIPEIKDIEQVTVTLILLCCFIVAEWFGKNKDFALQDVYGLQKRSHRWAVYIFIIFIIGMYMQTEESPFIYFQF